MTNLSAFFAGCVAGVLMLLFVIVIIDLVAAEAGHRACVINTGEECEKEWRPTNDE